MKKWNVLIQEEKTGHISIEIITAETRKSAMEIAESLNKGIARDAVVVIQSER